MTRAASRIGPPWPAVWAKTKQIAPWALALLVLVLLARHAHTIEWSEVWGALQKQPLGGLGIAAVLALVSHGLFSSYELVGRHETGHKLPMPRTLGIGAVCYAFNLNFGSLVGALAIKLRLYDRAGVKAKQVARIIVLSIVTNWIGYLFVGGLVMLLSPPPMPQRIDLSDGALRAIGAAMVGVSLAYVLACALRHGKEITVRGHRFAVPVLRVALWQLAVASANWALMGVIVWVLLAQSVPYATVVGVLLLGRGGRRGNARAGRAGRARGSVRRLPARRGDTHRAGRAAQLSRGLLPRAAGVGLDRLCGRRDLSPRHDTGRDAETPRRAALTAAHSLALRQDGLGRDRVACEFEGPLAEDACACDVALRWIRGGIRAIG